MIERSRNSFGVSACGERNGRVNGDKSTPPSHRVQWLCQAHVSCAVGWSGIYSWHHFLPTYFLSANNFLIIEEQPDGSFKAYDRSVEGEYKKDEGSFAFAAKDEHAAIVAAQQYMAEEIVEYGYEFQFLPVIKEPVFPHTPGPWFGVVQADENTDIYPSIWNGENNEGAKMALIAQVSSWLASSSAAREARANARLIIAAPDLLKALNGMVWIFKELLPSEATKSGHVKIAEDAIAKATL